MHGALSRLKVGIVTPTDRQISKYDMSRRIHFVVGVTEDRFDEALDFYQKIFNDIKPEVGHVKLGTGREVYGAQFYSDYVNFYVFVGHELNNTHGLDHLGVEFDSADECEDVRKSLNSSRWLKDPYWNGTIELFQKGTIDD